jgi:hypothetical protein
VGEARLTVIAIRSMQRRIANGDLRCVTCRGRASRIAGRRGEYTALCASCADGAILDGRIAAMRAEGECRRSRS